MPNTNAPNGFRAVRQQSGMERLTEYDIASGTAGNIFSGDVVKLLTTGVIAVAAPGDVNLIGVFAGDVRYSAADGSVVFNRYWPSGTVTNGAANAKCLVNDDPSTIYLTQSSGATVFNKNMVGANANFVAGAGSTATGQSGFDLDISAPGTGAANFRIVRFADGIPGNDPAAANAQVEVKFNQHLFLSTTGI